MGMQRIFRRASILFALAAPIGAHAFSVSGSATSFAGNNGNPVLTTPTITLNTVGTRSSGIITGPTGDQAEAHFTLSLNPTPTISLFARGSDGAGVNSATGFASATIDYSFVALPAPGHNAGESVVVDFSGLALSQLLFAGDNSIDNNSAGARLTLGAHSIAATIHDAGSIGTEPTVAAPFNGGADHVLIGWGADVFGGPVDPNFKDVFRFGFGATTGETITVKLQGSVSGSLRGVTNPSGTPSAGNVSLVLDPFFFIDPDFALDHPG